MFILPDWFDATRLTPIKYYRYKSAVTSRFFQMDAYDTSADRREYIKKFLELKTKCMALPLKTEDGISKEIWDNKVVIECKTEKGDIVFVGFYDWTYSIGLGVSGDSWIKPWEYQLSELVPK